MHRVRRRRHDRLRIISAPALVAALKRAEFREDRRKLALVPDPDRAGDRAVGGVDEGFDRAGLDLFVERVDLVTPEQAAAWAARYDGVEVSARARRGLADLIRAAEERLGREEPLVRTYEARPLEPPSA